MPRPQKKNWPRCCPVAVMDIKGEVPQELQGVVSVAYLSYLVPPPAARLPPPFPDRAACGPCAQELGFRPPAW